MEARDTIAGRIASADPEAFDLLVKMLSRPAMFIGVSRFDYLQYFFDGYCKGRNNSVNFMPDREIQYWLFHNYSASFSGDIKGDSLFYRCFGAEETAFEKYKELMYYGLDFCSGSVTDEIYAYEEEHDLVRYEWEDTEPGHFINLAKAVSDNIMQMIVSSGYRAEDIKVYIRKERLFTMVRFLYRSGSEWFDDRNIIADPENHKYLIAAHANAKCATADALKDMGYFVNDAKDKSFSFKPEKIPEEEKTLDYGYLEWKNENNLRGV